MSIGTLPFLKVLSDGEIEDTDVMALFRIESHYSTGVQETSPSGPSEEILYYKRLPREVNEQHEAYAAWLAKHPHTTDHTICTFQALITFFDAVARERIGPAKSHQGHLPNEIYALILQHVLDPPTRHACMIWFRTPFDQIEFRYPEVCQIMNSTYRIVAWSLLPT